MTQTVPPAPRRNLGGLPVAAPGRLAAVAPPGVAEGGRSADASDASGDSPEGAA
jgi:hypothetical protein